MMHKIKQFIYFSLGFFATSPVLAIPLQGKYTSLYSVALIFVFIDLIVSRKKQISSLIEVNYFIVWSIIGLLSSYFGYLYFSGDTAFESASIQFVSKILIYLFVGVLLFKSCDVHKTSAIANGLLLGMSINLIVAFADAMGYYLTGVSFINTTFAGYIAANNIRYGSLALQIGSTIRSAGFNADPANIGLFSAVIASYALYSKKYIYMVLSLLGALAATSVIALISIIVLLLIHAPSKKNIIGVISFVGVAILLLSVINSPVIETMRALLLDRMYNNVSAIANDPTDVRGIYWYDFVSAVLNSSHSIIIGSGYGTASYAYYINGNTFANFPYDPEQTYFSYFFDIGMIGLVVMLMMYVKLFKRLKYTIKGSSNKQAFIFLAGIEGMAIAAMGYHYTIYSVVMLFTIAGISYVSHNEQAVKLEKDSALVLHK